MKTKAKVVMWSFVAMPFVIAIMLVGMWGQKSQIEHELGAVSWETLSAITGGAEGGDCVVWEENFLCSSDGFPQTEDCSGCVNLNAETNPQTVKIGSGEQVTTITCGSSTKVANYIQNVDCTAVTTCEYVKEPGVTCEYNSFVMQCTGPFNPDLACYYLSGDPPAVWDSKDHAECLDP